MRRVRPREIVQPGSRFRYLRFLSVEHNVKRVKWYARRVELRMLGRRDLVLLKFRMKNRRRARAART